jgi:hypothetical protein
MIETAKEGESIVGHTSGYTYVPQDIYICCEEPGMVSITNWQYTIPFISDPCFI